MIRPDRYDDLLVGLAMRRHGHLAIEARSLVRAMRQDGDGDTWRFDALADFIGAADADVVSHIGVVRTFLHEAWPRVGVAPLPVMRLSGMLIGELLRCQPNQLAATLAAVRITAAGAPRRYVDGWITGHFYSRQEVDAIEERVRSAARETPKVTPWKTDPVEGRQDRLGQGKPRRPRHRSRTWQTPVRRDAALQFRTKPRGGPDAHDDPEAIGGREGAAPIGLS